MKRTMEGMVTDDATDDSSSLIALDGVLLPAGTPVTVTYEVTEKKVHQCGGLGPMRRYCLLDNGDDTLRWTVQVLGNPGGDEWLYCHAAMGAQAHCEACGERLDGRPSRDKAILEAVRVFMKQEDAPAARGLRQRAGTYGHASPMHHLLRALAAALDMPEVTDD